MLRVLYIINHADLSGSNRSLLNIIDGIRQVHKFEPFVVMGYRGRMEEELEKRGINYCIIPHCFSIYPTFDGMGVLDKLRIPQRIAKSLWMNKQAIKKATNYAIANSVKIIHTNIGPEIIGYQVAKRLKLPHFWHIREYQDADFNMIPFPSKGRHISKFKDPKNKILATTQSLKKYFLLEDLAMVIHNGVMWSNEACFSKDKKPYFLFVGRLEPAKGIDELISGFEIFAKKGYTQELWIVGTGNEAYIKHTEGQIAKRGLQKSIKLLGYRDDARILMKNALALLVTSKSEGFGRITVEAMFNGCLVIGKSTAGTAEILKENSLGLLFDDVNGLSLELEKVVNNDSAYVEGMIKKAQQEAINKYSIERCSNKIYELYISAVPSSKLRDR